MALVADKVRTVGLMRRRSQYGSLGSRFGLIAGWALLIGVFSILRPQSFPTVSLFESMGSSGAPLLILTLALLPSLTAGELDLSLGGTFGLSLVVIGALNAQHHVDIILAVIVSLLCALIIGVVNAVLVVLIGIPSIVVTLGMGTLLAGVALGVTILPIAGVSAGLVSVSRHELLGLQMIFYYALALTVLVWYVFAQTPLGRYLFFVGSGRTVARLSGIRVDRLRAASLIFGAVIAGVAGILFAGLLGSTDPSVGPTFLLPAFAAAFLGATAVTPGRFNPWGAFIAVYFLETGVTGLQVLGQSGWVVQTFYGGSLVAAVVLSRVLGLGQTLTLGGRT